MSEENKDNSAPMNAERTSSNEANSNENPHSSFNSNISRRRFLQGVGALGAGILFGNKLEKVEAAAKTLEQLDMQTEVSRRDVVSVASTNEQAIPEEVNSSQTQENSQLSFSEGISENPHFNRVWARADQAVLDGTTDRTWMWGPEPRSNVIFEPYAEAEGGARQVIYFDKSRMEINNPNGDPNSEWYVTNGLLTTELISGNMQIGDEEFEEREPAEIQIAGDPGDPNAPTYATFSRNPDLLSPKEYRGAGMLLNQRIDRNGTISDDSRYAKYDQKLSSEFTPATGHQVAQVFLDEMYQQLEDGTIPNLYYPYGYPVSEPYWTTVEVNGTPTDVMVQMFQRRVMTYTPSNPDKWKVETGNVGQHYYKWRYGREPHRLEQEERNKISEVHQNLEEVMSGYLQQKDTPAFDEAFFNNLPQSVDQYIKDKRWWMGAYLTGTGLMHGLSGDSDSAYRFMKKSWQYKRQNMQIQGSSDASAKAEVQRTPGTYMSQEQSLDANGVPSDNKTTEVFLMYEDMLVLKLHGNELMDRDPHMVNEMLQVMEQMADNYARQNPPGNDESNIKTNSYGETNAGIAAHLMGMASLQPNHPNRDQWVESAHKYAKAAFAVRDEIGGEIITTAVEEGDELWIYNHGGKNATYTLTTIGQLELAKMYALSAGIEAGPEFSHNIERAFATVMKYIDQNNLYTLEQNQPYRGYDEYLMRPAHQAYFVDVEDKDSVLRFSRDHKVDFKLLDFTPPYGVFSQEFQKNVDPKFAADCERYFEALEYERVTVKDIMAQLLTGQIPEINGRRVSFFTNYNN